MDLVLLLLSVILILTGLIGAVLPVIPGPPLSFLALLLIHFTRYAGFTAEFLVLMGFIALAATILDFFLPVWMTGKSGGSKYGVRGAAIGLVAGIFFFPPFGILIGPVVGAIAGELFYGKKGRQAVVAGLAAFSGFLMGTGVKLAASLVMTFYYFRALF